MEHGAQQRGNTHQRLAYARSLWVEDPSIPIDGPTGMIRKLYDRYGESASHGALEVIRREAKVARIRQGTATTNVGAKVAIALTGPLPAASPTPAQPPALAVVPPPPKPKRVQRKLPAGAMLPNAIRERREYARAVFVQRPNISIKGADGLEELLLARFGASVTPDVLEEIRAEVKSAITALPPVPPAPPVVAPVAAPAVVEPEPVVDVNEVLSTIASMALEAIPNLAKLTVDVDAAGRVQLGYVVREIKTTEMVIEVRR